MEKTYKMKKENKYKEIFMLPEKEELKGKAVRGASATIIFNLLNFGIQMVGTIVLARLLTPDEFGLIAMVAAFSYLLMNFGNRGFTEAVVQADHISHKILSSIFWVHLAITIILMMVFIGFAPLMAKLYNEPRITGIAIAFTLTFLFTMLSTHHIALLARKMEFYKVMGIEFGANLLSAILAITMASIGFNYWSLVARRVSIPFGIFVGAWILCKWVPSLSVGIKGIEIRKNVEMFKFSLNTFANFATNYVTKNLDKVLLGWKYGSHSLGFYDRAYYLFIMPVNNLSYPLTNVAVATLSRLRDEPEKFKNYYLSALSLIAFVGYFISVVFTITGKNIMIILLGSEWEKAGDLFVLFGPGIAVMLIYGTIAWLHLALGRPDRWVRWGIFELITTASFFAVGLKYGSTGIVVAYVSSIYLIFIPGLGYAGQPVGIGVGMIVKCIWRYILAGVLSVSGSLYLISKIEATTIFYKEKDLLLRVFIDATGCSILYFCLVIALYGSFKPITQLVSIGKEMLNRSNN